MFCYFGLLNAVTSLILTYSRRKTAGVFGDGSRTQRTLFWFCNKRGHQVQVILHSRVEQTVHKLSTSFSSPKNQKVNSVQTVDDFHLVCEILYRKDKLSGRCIKSRCRHPEYCYCFICVFPVIVNYTGVSLITGSVKTNTSVTMSRFLCIILLVVSAESGSSYLCDRNEISISFIIFTGSRQLPSLTNGHTETKPSNKHREHRERHHHHHSHDNHLKPSPSPKVRHRSPQQKAAKVSFHFSVKVLKNMDDLTKDVHQVAVAPVGGILGTFTRYLLVLVCFCIFYHCDHLFHLYWLIQVSFVIGSSSFQRGCLDTL